MDGLRPRQRAAHVYQDAGCEGSFGQEADRARVCVTCDRLRTALDCKETHFELNIDSFHFLCNRELVVSKFLKFLAEMLNFQALQSSDDFWRDD